MKNTWLKKPAVTSKGGKNYFFFVARSQARFWVAWHFHEMKWGADCSPDAVGSKDFTIAFFDKTTDAKAACEKHPLWA